MRGRASMRFCVLVNRGLMNNHCVPQRSRTAKERKGRRCRGKNTRQRTLASLKQIFFNPRQDSRGPGLRARQGQARAQDTHPHIPADPDPGSHIHPPPHTPQQNYDDFIDSEGFDGGDGQVGVVGNDDNALDSFDNTGVVGSSGGAST